MPAYEVANSGGLETAETSCYSATSRVSLRRPVRVKAVDGAPAGVAVAGGGQSPLPPGACPAGGWCRSGSTPRGRVGRGMKPWRSGVHPAAGGAVSPAQAPSSRASIKEMEENRVPDVFIQQRL